MKLEASESKNYKHLTSYVIKLLSLSMFVHTSFLNLKKKNHIWLISRYTNSKDTI